MYYVLQVATGTEEKTELLIKGRVKDTVYGRCFHPLRHVRKKFHGKWKDFHEKLLPGYVFITSDSVGELYQELRQVPVLTKMLGKDKELFVALRRSEAEWLEKMMGGSGTAEAELSQVLAEADRIVILSGPLKDMEGCIKKIHLHKRMAEVEVDFMGKKTVVYLGVELVGKK